MEDVAPLAAAIAVRATIVVRGLLQAHDDEAVSVAQVSVLGRVPPDPC